MLNFIYILLFSFVLQSQSQLGSISGIVQDNRGNPIENANVFIDKTTIGVYSKNDGTFGLKNIPLGQQKLIVEHISYDGNSLELIFTSSKTKEITIELSGKPNSFDVVDVEALHPDEWNRLFQRFRSAFLGNSSAAKLCKILNPDVLDFKMEGKTLHIYANKPLQVNNKYLGYDMEFRISKCYIKNNILTYTLSTKFKDIKHTLDEQRILSNRRLAFKNSKRNFLKSLYYDMLEKNGFELGSLKKVSKDSYFFTQRGYERHTLLSYSEHEGFIKFEAPKSVHIKHLDDDELDENWSPEHFHEQKYSQIEFLNDSYFFFNKDGHTLFLNEDIVFKGYFGFLKLANELPLNFKPSL